MNSTFKPRGLFLNPSKANCSIHESGRMVFDCLKLSDKYDLDYLELSAQKRDISTAYNFYVFNYHHLTMGWLDTKSVRRLPGLKLTFVLETLRNDPFVLCPPDAFDVYCALDPTMNVTDKRVSTSVGNRACDASFSNTRNSRNRELRFCNAGQRLRVGR